MTSIIFIGRWKKIINLVRIHCWMLVADIIRAVSSYTPVFAFAGEHIWSGRDHELTEQMIKSPFQSIEQTNCYNFNHYCYQKNWFGSSELLLVGNILFELQQQCLFWCSTHLWTFLSQNNTKAPFVDVIDCDTVIRPAKWDYTDKLFADFIKQA